MVSTNLILVLLCLAAVAAISVAAKRPAQEDTDQEHGPQPPESKTQ